MDSSENPPLLWRPENYRARKDADYGVLSPTLIFFFLIMGNGSSPSPRPLPRRLNRVDHSG